jgi:hypothetical protein
MLRAVSVSVAAPLAPVITDAITRSLAADALIAPAIPATVLFVPSMTTFTVTPPLVIASVPVPTGVVAARNGVDWSLCAAAR